MTAATPDDTDTGTGTAAATATTAGNGAGAAGPGRPLRIGYLSGSPRIATRDDAEVAGPRSHILGLIDALRADGHRVDEFILGDLLDRRVSGEGSQRFVSGSWARQFAVDVARLGLRATLARRAVGHLTEPLDVVYERFALFQHLGRPFQRRGVPWVLETNAVMAQEARKERNALALQRLAARLERDTYRRADLVVCVSEPLRQMLIDHAAVDPDALLVVPNGVDTDRFAPDGVPAGDVAGPEIVIGFVGYVIERQGIDELIDAVRVLRQRGHAARAVVVGDGPDLRRLRRRVRDEHLEDAVTFTGQVPWTEVPGHIASFTVGYSGQRGVGGMPMYHSPLKIYEYMAMQRPVVASRHDDAEAAILGPEAGWVFPPSDVEALVEVLDEVCSTEPDALSAVGRRGREHVVANHTWRDRADTILAEITRRGLVS